MALCDLLKSSETYIILKRKGDYKSVIQRYIIRWIHGTQSPLLIFIRFILVKENYKIQKVESEGLCVNF